MALIVEPDMLEPEREACAQFDAICATVQQGAPPMPWPGTHWTSGFWQELLSRALRNPLSRNVNAANAADIAALDSARALIATQERFREAMSYVCQIARHRREIEYSPELFQTLHYLVSRGSAKAQPGCLRAGRVTVHYSNNPKQAYKPADAEVVPTLLWELCGYLNAPPKSHVLVTTAIAHLNLALIHPFSDGNGRVVRCLHALLLMRAGLTDPLLCSLDAFLGMKTQDYDEVLAGVSGGAWNPQRDAHPWIRYCLGGHLWQAQCLRHQLDVGVRVWEYVDGLVRAHDLPARLVPLLLDALADSGTGGAPGNRQAGQTDDKIAWGIDKLVELGVLIRDQNSAGKLVASEPLRRLTDVTVSPFPPRPSSCPSPEAPFI